MELILAGIAAFGVGFALGMGSKTKKKPPETVGTLWIDVSKPEDPYLYTTLNTTPNETEWDKYATFDVKIIK